MAVIYRVHLHVANRVRSAVLVIVALAWVMAVMAAAGGAASALHHHALIEGGSPLWIAIPLFLAAWLVMVAAMMLPASLPVCIIDGSDDPGRRRMAKRQPRRR